MNTISAEAKNVLFGSVGIRWQQTNPFPSLVELMRHFIFVDTDFEIIVIVLPKGHKRYMILKY